MKESENSRFPLRPSDELILHFHILKLNLNFPRCRNTRQFTKRNPPTINRPTTAAKIPFREKVPCKRSVMLPAAYCPVKINTASLMNFPQKNGGTVRTGFTLAMAAAVNKADVESGVKVYTKTNSQLIQSFCPSLFPRNSSSSF